MLKNRQIKASLLRLLQLLTATLAAAVACGLLSTALFAATSARWMDLAGEWQDPFQATNSKALVFIFIKTDCPISNRYAPEIRRLHEKYASRGARFWLVHADPDESLANILQHAREYQYPCGALRDPEHRLVQLCQARVTPEAALFTSERRLVYHGRIDDRFPALGRQRAAPTRHDLAEALEAVLNGKAPDEASAPAVGCAIAPLTGTSSSNGRAKER